jgi:hypothetical protein
MASTANSVASSAVSGCGVSVADLFGDEARRGGIREALGQAGERQGMFGHFPGRKPLHINVSRWGFRPVLKQLDNVGVWPKIPMRQI